MHHGRNRRLYSLMIRRLCLHTDGNLLLHTNRALSAYQRSLICILRDVSNILHIIIFIFLNAALALPSVSLVLIPLLIFSKQLVKLLDQFASMLL